MESQYHELKIWPENFQAIVHYKKTYEVRKADRAFRVGDRITFREWSPTTKEYTGQDCAARIVYMTLAGTWGLPDDLCVFGIEVL